MIESSINQPSCYLFKTSFIQMKHGANIITKLIFFVSKEDRETRSTTAVDPRHRLEY